jgi:hypothetical protein
MNNRTETEIETGAADQATKRSQAGGRALRANAPLLVLGALLAGTLLTRCSSSKDPAPGTPGSAGAGGAAAGTPGSAGAGGAGGAAGGSTECTPTTVATDCPLPPSTCEDAATLGYYTDASCVAGRCQWTRLIFSCSGACRSGACIGSGTTTTGGPPAPGTGGTGGGGGGGGGDGGTPLATCTAGGDAGGTCALPRSLCADARTLLTFANPRCVQSVCQTDVTAIDCVSGCTDGGCQ